MKKYKASFFTLFVLVIVVSYFFWQKNQKNSSVTTRKMPIVTVDIAQVQEHKISRNLLLIGNITSQKAVMIASEVGGKIEKIHVQSGDFVKKDQLLVSLNSKKSQALLAEATAFYQDELRKFNEFSLLNERGALTKTELDAQHSKLDIAKARLNAAQTNQDDHQIKAPFDGTIGLIDITQGQLITTGEVLLHLDDLSVMQLDIDVPEQYISELTQNINVSATSQAWPEKNFLGKLIGIDTRVNQNSLNLRARINIQNNEKYLLPGMMLEANLIFSPEIKPMIPVQAIEYSGTKRFVYKVDDKAIARRTEVKLGARQENKVAVEQGLELEDKIVVQGLVNMRDGIQVQNLEISPKEGN